jgi:hypothetical protein
VGDFNKDGKPDVAVANTGADDVSVFLNTTPSASSAGGGPTLPTFSHQLLPVGHQPVDVAVGDFNQDGNQDIATANQGANSASVLLNAGSAAFTPAINVPMGVEPRSIAAGDFNGDGRSDLAVANSGNSASPTATGSLTVALAKGGTAKFAAAPRRKRARARGTARGRAAAKRPHTARGIRVGARARLRGGRFVSRGKSSFGRDGIFRARGWLMTGELSIRYKATRLFLSRFPRGLRHGVRARTLARFDGELHPGPDGRDRVVARGLVVGRVRNRPGASLCVRVRYDSAHRKSSRARVLGGTGALAGFTGTGRMPLVGFTGDSRKGSLTLRVKGGHRHKLPRACRTLLRRLPKSPRKRVR